MADNKITTDEVKEDSLIDPIYQKFVKGVIRAIGSTDFYEFFMDAVSRAQNEKNDRTAFRRPALFRVSRLT